LDTSGNFLPAGGSPVSANTEDQSRPAVAYDGTEAWAAWQENPSGTVGVMNFDSSANPRGPPVQFAGGTPRLTFDGQGRGLLVYVTDAGTTTRARARLLGPCATPGACVVYSDGGTGGNGPALWSYRVGCGCQSASDPGALIACALLAALGMSFIRAYRPKL
jgi:MYXO-CTERM domain-containing protein